MGLLEHVCVLEQIWYYKYSLCWYGHQLFPPVYGECQLIDGMLKKYSGTRPLVVGDADPLFLIHQIVELFFELVFFYAAVLAIENVSCGKILFFFIIKFYVPFIIISLR